MNKYRLSLSGRAKNRIAAGFVVLFLAALAAGIVAVAVLAYKGVQHERAATQATVTITVQDKKAVCTTETDTYTGSLGGKHSTTSQSCTYLIYTNAGIFADKDEFTAHKTDSAALYGQLMYDGQYQVTVRGTRRDNLGLYPNIIAVTATLKPGHPSPAVVIAPASP